MRMFLFFSTPGIFSHGERRGGKLSQEAWWWRIFNILWKKFSTLANWIFTVNVLFYFSTRNFHVADFRAWLFVGIVYFGRICAIRDDSYKPMVFGKCLFRGWDQTLFFQQKYIWHIFAILIVHSDGSYVMI